MRKGAALVGFGYWGPNIARNLNNSEYFELKVIVDVLMEKGRWELADKLLLVKELREQGKPYKKILREEHGIVA